MYRKIMTPFDLHTFRSNSEGATSNQLLTLFWQSSQVTSLWKWAHNFSQTPLTVQREEDRLGKTNEACALGKNLREINRQVFVQVLSKVAMAEEGTRFFAE